MAGITHYINTAASEISLARWPSLINSQPQPFPVLVFGDTRPHQFFFHNDGTIEDFSGNNAYSFQVTIGDVNAGPVAGAYTLTCSTPTASLAWNAAAADIQAALNAIPTIATAGGVIVTGVFPSFQISFNLAGARTAITASAVGLTPPGGIGLISLQTGDSSHTQQWALVLRQNPICLQTSWTGVVSPNNGWSGYLPTNTAEALALLISQGVMTGGIWELSTVLQALVIDGSGNMVSYYQTPVILRASNLDISTLVSPVVIPTLPTLAQITAGFVINRTLVGIASAGVDATKLCGIATAGGVMPTNAKVIASFGSNLQAFFEFIPSTSTLAGFLFKPFDYDASTNPNQWRLRAVWNLGVPCLYNADTTFWHFIIAAGAANAVTLQVDQTGQALPT
jgi:hypothetical protein